MKILITTLCYPDECGFMGGNFIHNQARALLERGDEVTVLNVDMRSIRKRRPMGFSRYTLDGVRVYRYAFPCGPFSNFVYAIAPRFAEYIFRKVCNELGAPNILHAHFMNGGLLAETIWKRYGIPYVITEHGNNILNDNLTAKERKLVNSVYNNAAAIIAVGSTLGEAIGKYTKKPIQIIPNMLPNYFFYKEHEVKDGKQPYKFISAGGLIPGKNFELLLDAFALLSYKEECSLVIVGEGPELHNLEKKIVNLGIEKQVVLMGKLDNTMLPDLYQKADCFVLPSESETFGVVYIEAMACGIPVIATRCGGPEDYVNDMNGLLVKKNDVSSLSESMQYMVEHRTEYNKHNIANEIQKKYGEDIICRQLEDIYFDVLQSGDLR